MQTIQEIIHLYDAFIIDLWGVIHNGKKAFPGAIEVLEQLKRAGKPVLFLSNAPRRVENAQTQLVERGVPAHLYDFLYTSGEDCHLLLKSRDHPWYQELGRHVYHLGPNKDKNLLENVDFAVVDDLSKADFILNTGTLSWDCQLSDYDVLLQQAAASMLPMICANPDKIVMLGDKQSLCAGTLAQKYEELGGDVFYHGKPHASIYESVYSILGVFDRRRILVVGDSLMTDIKGAAEQGMDSLFVLSGIHGGCPDLEGLYKEYGVRPTYVADKLVW